MLTLQKSARNLLSSLYHDKSDTLYYDIQYHNKNKEIELIFIGLNKFLALIHQHKEDYDIYRHSPNHNQQQIH